MRYIYGYCYCCETYKKYEIDNETFFRLKSYGLLFSKSKVHIICKECLEIMKGENGYNE